MMITSALSNTAAADYGVVLGRRDGGTEEGWPIFSSWLRCSMRILMGEFVNIMVCGGQIMPFEADSHVTAAPGGPDR